MAAGGIRSHVFELCVRCSYGLNNAAPFSITLTGTVVEVVKASRAKCDDVGLCNIQKRKKRTNVVAYVFTDVPAAGPGFVKVNSDESRSSRRNISKNI